MLRSSLSIGGYPGESQKKEYRMVAFSARTRERINSEQLCHGYRFPPTILSHAVWLDYRFCLSFRDVEDLLAERGIVVSYESIRQCCRVSLRQYSGKAS